MSPAESDEVEEVGGSHHATMLGSHQVESEEKRRLFESLLDTCGETPVLLNRFKNQPC